MAKSIMDRIGAGTQFVGRKKKVAETIIKSENLIEDKKNEEKIDLNVTISIDSIEEKNYLDNDKEDFFCLPDFRKISEKKPVNINEDLWWRLMPGDYDLVTSEAANLIFENMSRVEAVEKAIIKITNKLYYKENKDTTRLIWRELFEKKDKSFLATWREQNDIPEYVKYIMDSLFSTVNMEWMNIVNHPESAFYFRKWHSFENECMVCQKNVEKGSGFRIKKEDGWDYIHSKCKNKFYTIKDIYIDFIVKNAKIKFEYYQKEEEENRIFWEEEEKKLRLMDEKENQFLNIDTNT